jgi:hypothetical protein
MSSSIPSTEEPPQRRRIDHDHERRRRQEIRDKVVQGVDLLALAQSNPSSLKYDQKLELLGRAVYLYDEEEFIKQQGVRGMPAVFLEGRVAHEADILRNVELCKFVICDCRVPQGSETMDALYTAQLRLEEEKAPLEQVRESLRTDVQKRARHNARKMLAEYERFAAAGVEAPRAQDLWAAIEPPLPGFARELLERYPQEKYGFGFCRTKELEGRLGDDVEGTWEKWLKYFRYPSGTTAIFEGYKRCVVGIYKNRLGLERLMREEWMDFVGSEDDSSSMRRYDLPLSHRLSPPPSSSTHAGELTHRSDFKHWRENTTDLSPAILKDTFIVVGRDCVPLDLGTASSINVDKLPPFWVWAYDAEWASPLPTSSGKQNDVDEDGYDGRIKVPVNRLYTWFYAARLEGTNMKLMWKKSQAHPEKLWTCETLYLQDWAHEPFV